MKIWIFSCLLYADATSTIKILTVKPKKYAPFQSHFMEMMLNRSGDTLWLTRTDVSLTARMAARSLGVPSSATLSLMMGKESPCAAPDTNKGTAQSHNSGIKDKKASGRV